MSLRVMTIAFVICLTVPASAKETVVRLNWDETRTVLTNDGFRPKIRVWRKADSSRPTKAKLLEATETGLRLARGKAERFMPKDAIRSIRLAPRKADRRKHGNLAAVVALPVAFGTMLGTWAISCSLLPCDESGGGAGMLAVPAGVAVPVLLYMRAWRADRGSLRIVLRVGD